MSDRLNDQYERSDPPASYGENFTRRAEEATGGSTGREQESTGERGLGTSVGAINTTGSTGRRELGDESSAGRQDLGSDFGTGGRTEQSRGRDDTFMSSRDPTTGEQHGAGDPYGSRPGREDTERVYHPKEDTGDDPLMSGRDKPRDEGAGLGGRGGHDSGMKDDRKKGAYAGEGHPRKKRDSISGKIMEKAGGIFGSSKMEEKGHEKREAKYRGE